MDKQKNEYKISLREWADLHLDAILIWSIIGIVASVFVVLIWYSIDSNKPENIFARCMRYELFTEAECETIKQWEMIQK